MEINLWLAYVTVISLLIFSPGPSAILCLDHGVRYGATKSIYTILGGSIASLFLMALSAFGLGVLLLASAHAFMAVKLVGALYLIYLGIVMWREGGKGFHSSTSSKEYTEANKASMFKTGFLVGISNPKDIIFFAALFPNFVSIEQPQGVQFFLLALTWVVIDFVAMFLYSSMGLRVAPWFENKVNMLRFNRFMGGVFVTAGGLLAMSSKKI